MAEQRRGLRFVVDAATGAAIRSIAGVQQNLDALGRSAQAAGAKVDKALTPDQKSAADAIKKQRAQLEQAFGKLGGRSSDWAAKQEAGYRKAFETIRTSGTASARQVGNAFYTMQAQISRARQEANLSASSFEKMRAAAGVLKNAAGSGLNGAGNLLKGVVGGAVSTVTGAVGGAVRAGEIGGAVGLAGLIGAIHHAVREYTEYETALTRVAKTANINEEQQRALSRSFDQLGARLPVTTMELLDIAKTAGQLGVSGVRDITDFTATVAKLRAASNLTGEEAAFDLARVLNVLKEPLAQAKVLASQWIALSNRMGAKESEIAEQTLQLSQALSTFGVASKDVSALGAAFASIGVEPELAASTTQRVFQTIRNAIDGVGKGSQIVNQMIGLSGDALKQAWGEDSLGVVQKFLAALGNVEKTGANVKTVLADMGLDNIRTERVLPALAATADRLEQARGISDSQSKAAAASEEAKKRIDEIDEEIARRKALGNVSQATADKLAEIDNKRAVLVDKRDSDEGLTGAEKKRLAAYDAQEAQIRSHIKAASDQEITALENKRRASQKEINDSGLLIDKENDRAAGTPEGQLTQITNRIGIAWRKFGADITPDLVKLAKSFADFFDKIIERRGPVVAAINSVVEWITARVNDVRNLLSGNQKAVKADWLKDLWNGFSIFFSWLKQNGPEILSGLGQIATGVLSFVGAIGRAFSGDAKSNPVIGFLNALGTAAAGAKDDVIKLLKDLTAMLQGGNASNFPMLNTLRDIIEAIVNGLAKAIKYIGEIEHDQGVLNKTNTDGDNTVKHPVASRIADFVANHPEGTVGTIAGLGALNLAFLGLAPIVKTTATLFKGAGAAAGSFLVPILRDASSSGTAANAARAAAAAAPGAVAGAAPGAAAAAEAAAPLVAGAIPAAAAAAAPEAVVAAGGAAGVGGTALGAELGIASIAGEGTALGTAAAGPIAAAIAAVLGVGGAAGYFGTVAIGKALGLGDFAKRNPDPQSRSVRFNDVDIAADAAANNKPKFTQSSASIMSVEDRAHGNWLQSDNDIDDLNDSTHAGVRGAMAARLRAYEQSLHAASEGISLPDVTPPPSGFTAPQASTAAIAPSGQNNPTSNLTPINLHIGDDPDAIAVLASEKVVAQLVAKAQSQPNALPRSFSSQ